MAGPASTLLTRRGLLACAAALGPANACGRATSPDERGPTRTGGLDPALIAETLRTAEALPQLRSIIVARDGRPVIERAFRGPSLDVPVNIKSAAKTVLSAVAGAAIDRKVLQGLDQPVAPILGRRVPVSADPRVRRITVEHLLSMEAGLEPTSGSNYGRWVSSRDWVGFALGRPFVADPGGPMLYSTGTSHILSAVLTAASGKTTHELARTWIAQPLGIAIPPWPRDPQGIYFGGNDMLMSPRALLAFGELYRNRGLHKGVRVLPKSWVDDSWRSRGGRSPWTGYTYGLGWWIRSAGRHPVYFAWGYGGQMVYVVPSLALTAVMTSNANARGVDGHVQALHAMVDQLIVPAAERGGQGASAT